MSEFNTQEQQQPPPSFLDDDDCLKKVRQELGQRNPVTCTILDELPDPPKEEDNPNAIFKGGYLRKGGAMLLVSTTGTGKSVMTIQASMCWSVGVEAFGICPVRPQTVAIIQAEDDATEVADFRNQISRGLIESGTLTSDQLRNARKSILVADFVGLVGKEFITAFRQFLDTHQEIGLVVLNPLQSYFGGNLQQNNEVSAFFRTGLDPIIKDRVGLVIVHHTGKPPNKAERDGWGTDQFSAYIGAGGAELVNWVRAVMLLMPTAAQGVFALVAGKRGMRLGWQTSDGLPTKNRYIAHCRDYIFWRDASEDEAQAAGAAKNKTIDREGQTKKNAEYLADLVRKSAMALTDIRGAARDRFGKSAGDRAYEYLLENLKDFLLSEVQARCKQKTFLGTIAEAEAAARSWDIQNTKKN